MYRIMPFVTELQMVDERAFFKHAAPPALPPPMPGYHSARFASISMLMATVWLMPEIVSVAGANIKLNSRRVIGSVVTVQRVRAVSFIGVSSFT